MPGFIFPPFTLLLSPDSQGFAVAEGSTNIAVQLDGGGPRIRSDKVGAVKLVDCQWTLRPENYDYFMAFYRTAINFGAMPFNISLRGIDNSEVGTYVAWFVPGTLKPIASQSGLTYVIKAQMWVIPTAITSTADNTIIAAGPIP